ncbi:F-box domain-containing protein [Mycena chlorophos]|uniref:F-box domain-containing protein n=1 Tax=Mycena chlorophos TaxID=658473 RepID=A0A8H6S7Q2_MYCCL|nr:F-box domain-containing protein [Mycena chlorophos]
MRKAVPELQGHSHKSLYLHYKRNSKAYDGWCKEAAAKEAAKGIRVNPRESIYNYAPTSPPTESCIINAADAPFLIALGLQRLADTHGVDLAEATRVWSFSNRDFRTADCVFIGRGIKDEDLRDDSDPEVMHEELMYLDSGESEEDGGPGSDSDDAMDEDEVGDGIGVAVQVAARGGDAVDKSSSDLDSDEAMPVVGEENSSSDADDEKSETGDVDDVEASVGDLDTTSRVLAWRKLQLAHENDDEAQTGDGDAPRTTPNIPLPSPALATASAVADLDMVPTDTEAAHPPQPPPLRPNGTRNWGRRVRTMAARPMLKPSGSRVTHFTEDEDDPPFIISYSQQQRDSGNGGEESDGEEDSEGGSYIPTQASLFGRG